MRGARNGETAKWIEVGLAPPVFRKDGRMTPVEVYKMRDFYRNRWPDLLAIACVGVAWLLTAVLGT